MAAMKREEKNGTVWMDCSRCGEMFQAFEVSDLSRTMNLESLYSMDDFRICAKCREAAESEAARQEAGKKRREFLASIPTLAAKSGIPDLYRIHRQTGEPLTAPLVPHVVKWLWKHRDCNLLVSGKTGVGKSTSACFVAVKMLEEGKHVRYVKLRRLLSEWREARTSDEPFADERFFDRIQKLHLLILDEVADKTKTTESGQEMMYELLDMIADGEIKTRLWMLGNFREGGLKELFGDTDPVYRRLEENFVCVGIDERSIERIHVFNQSQGE